MQALRRPWVWIPLLLVLLFGGAVLAGYTLLPGVVRSQGSQWVEKNLPGKQLTMGEIAFDPWQLLLTIDDIAVADGKAPQAPLVTIKQLKVDAGIASLWSLAPRLDALIVTDPVVDAILRKDGSLNLAELVPVDDGSPIPDVRIASLDVAGGKISFTDARPATPQRQMLSPVTFNLKDFATTANDGGGFRLDAASEAGERFQWTGTLGMAPLASQGRFTITDLQLATIGRFAGDLIPAKLSAGGIDMAGQYRFAVPPAVKGAAPPPQFDADITNLAVDKAELTASTGDTLAVERIAIAPTKISLAADDVTLGAISLTGLAISRPSGERARITSARLGPTHYGISSGVAAIGDLSVDGISITGRGKSAETVALAKLTVAPSEARLTPREARIGAISASGLRLGAKVAADNSVSVPGLYPMKPARRRQAQRPRLEDRARRLCLERRRRPPRRRAPGAHPGHHHQPRPADGQDRPADQRHGRAAEGRAGDRHRRQGQGQPLRHRQPENPDRRLRRQCRRPAARPLRRARPAQRRRRQGRHARPEGQAHPRQRQDRPRFLRRRPRHQFRPCRAHRGQPDHLLGRARPCPASAMIRHRKNSPSAASPSTRRSRTSSSPARPSSTLPPPPGSSRPPTAPPRPQRRPPPVKKAKLQSGRRRIEIAAPVSGTLNAAAKLFPVSIGEIAVRDSIISFEDFSIEPNFAAKIQGFNGTVTGLSTAPGSQATFDLKGYVIDRFSPVTITGKANVFAYDANTDLTAKFSNIELPVFNPYSGKWAGYAIAKGKLTTTLHYRIVNRGLKADHNIVLDQLTWGEATDSKEKVSLPVRLATSLLKDKDGVIDLDLPVEGTLDDPTFRIWPLVWKVVGNVMEKLVTAPFRAIGALFGGGDKAQFVDFDFGSATVPDDAGKSLAAVAKGLAEKTEVNLDIPAGPAIREDAEAMTTKALETAVLAGKKEPLAADYASLDAGKKLDRLKSVYKAKFGKGPSFPKEGVQKAGFLAGGDAKDAANASQIAWLETELRPKFAPTDAELAALGQARADAVKQVLLGDGSLPPTRVFIAGDKAVTAKDGKAQMELSVK